MSESTERSIQLLVEAHETTQRRIAELHEQKSRDSVWVKILTAVVGITGPLVIGLIAWIGQGMWDGIQANAASISAHDRLLVAREQPIMEFQRFKDAELPEIKRIVSQNTTEIRINRKDNKATLAYVKWVAEALEQNLSSDQRRRIGPPPEPEE